MNFQVANSGRDRMPAELKEIRALEQKYAAKVYKQGMELAKKIEEHAANREAHANKFEAECDKDIASNTADIEKLKAENAQIAKNKATMTHKLRVSAAAKAVIGGYVTMQKLETSNQQERDGFLKTALANSMPTADRLLIDLEKSKTVGLGEVNAQCKNMTFAEGTAALIAQTIKEDKLQLQFLDLTPFKKDINVQVATKLISDVAVTCVLFDVTAKEVAAEIQKKKAIRAFYFENNKFVPIQTMSTSISTSTNSSPVVPTYSPPRQYTAQEQEIINEVRQKYSPEEAEMFIKVGNIVKDGHDLLARVHERRAKEFSLAAQKSSNEIQAAQRQIDDAAQRKELTYKALLFRQGCQLISRNESDAAKIKPLVESILNQYQTYLTLTETVREKKCIRLTDATVSFLMQVLSKSGANFVNLTGFSNELVPGAYEKLISSKVITEVILSEDVQGNAILEKISSEIKAKKPLKVFYWKDSAKQLVEFKLALNPAYEGSPPKHSPN